MNFLFRAKIYKIGINSCVDVPARITSKMVPSKGYIPVKGKIMDFSFEQTLVPVKDKAYRLYVNGLMLKGSNSEVGDSVKFEIKQSKAKRKDATMPTILKTKLSTAGLMAAFNHLTPSRQKEILRYLNYLKTDEAKSRNIEKIQSLLENYKD